MMHYTERCWLIVIFRKNLLNEIEDDAFYNWTAEPTNVIATFVGNSETLITWQDQLGAEGEKYHIWRSNYYYLYLHHLLPNHYYLYLKSAQR